MTRAEKLLKQFNSPKSQILIFAILGILYFLTSEVGAYMMKDRESEAKSMLSSLYAAETAYFKEHGVYNESFEKIGYSPEGKLRGRIYLSPDEIPVEQRKMIPVDILPFVKEKSMRILYVLSLEKLLVCFTIDEMNEFKRVEVKLP